MRLYGSGTGNSFDADYLRCERYAFWLHHEGVRLRQQGGAAPLIVGSAGHKWMEVFHTIAERNGGFDLTLGIAHADASFHESVEEAMGEAKEFGYDLVDVEDRAETALNLLHALAPQFERRALLGEKTFEVEMHGTVELPDVPVPATAPRLNESTVQCDRVFYHPGASDLDAEDIPRTEGFALDEYKFTSASSPKSYAEEMLLNDQSLRYLYWLTKALAPNRVLGVRYRVFRVAPPITGKSYAEVWETVNQAKLDDWYNRQVRLRLEMNDRWVCDDMNEWHAARYSGGPCTRYGRDCPYMAFCDEPGAEASKVGEPEDVGTLYVRMPQQEAKERSRV